MILDSHVLSFIMAGGRGSRLKVLTRDKCKPAVDILGQYKIFDFVASNIAETEIPITIVATQFQSKSLCDYIGSGKAYGFDGISKKLEIVDASEETGEQLVFEGTADSVRKSADRIDKYNPRVVLVTGSDHVYNMNYKGFIKYHEASDSDVTIMTNVVPESRVNDLGIVRIDESGRVIDFAEKPRDKELIRSFKLTSKIKKRLGIDNPELNFLASMGNYAFFWDRLKRFLNSPGVDFARDLIPATKENGGLLHAYVFNGYWRDVGKIEDYFNCNMEFSNGTPPIELFKRQMDVYGEYLPFAHIANGVSVEGVILSSGDAIHGGSEIVNSVLGYRVVVEQDCRIDHCVLLGADRNGSHRNCIKGKGNTMRIGKGSSLKYAILDKNIWVGEGVDIGPHNGTPEARKQILQSIGLKPYKELEDGNFEGDFCIDLDTGILVIGKQNDADPKEPTLPDGLRC
jgi:glucose-1-phosphate adenylyltransferase